MLKRLSHLLLMAVLMLSSSGLCLELVFEGKSVQPGKLLIGPNSNTHKTDIVKKVHDEYAEESNGYQSDQPALRDGSRMAKLMFQRWRPTVSCANDSMTLCFQGSKVPNFLVETSDQGPVPLSQMPPHCGYSVKRARRDIRLTTSYDGCNVAQQMNTYILPLRVLGVGLKMVCPVVRPLTTVTCSPSAMVANLDMPIDAVKLKVNGVWQPVYQASPACGFTLDVVGRGLTLTAPYTSNCWQSEGSERLLSVEYKDGELTLSCPADQPPSTLLADTPPEIPTDAPMDTPTDAPTATLVTTIAPEGAEQALPPWFPEMYYPYGYGYGMPWNFPSGYPEIPSVTSTTAAPTTTTDAPATTVAAPSADPQALPPWFPGMYYPHGYGMPWRFHSGYPEIPPVTRTTAAPTTTTDALATTVAAPSADQQALPPWFPGMYYPYGYGMPWRFHSRHPEIPPATSTTAAPTTTRTATTVAPSSNAELPLYPMLPGMYNLYDSMASAGGAVSGFNDGVKSMYRTPWRNAFMYPGLHQKPSSTFPYHGYFPQQVKTGPAK